MAHAREAGIAHHLLELVRDGEAADALDEVLVALAVARNEPAEARHHAEAIGVIDGAQRAAFGHAEFEHAEAPARFEHTVEFPQSGVAVGDVADARGDDDRIGGGVREGQALGVADNPVEVEALVAGGVDTGHDHFRVDVADDGAGGRTAAAFAGFLALAAPAAREVTRAARHVEEELTRLGIELGDGHGLPDAVDAQTHRVVHAVIVPGDTVEDAAHAVGLFRLGHVAVAEVDGALTCRAHSP